ncbi:MAG: hypothetical protein WBI53_08455 [Paludibacter sp.]
MKYTFGLILFLFISCVNIFSQNINKDKILLKTGEVYIGEIVMSNNEIVMIKRLDGTRFQFPVSEIKSIEKVKSDEIDDNTNADISSLNAHEGNIGGLLEISGGIGSAKNKFGISPGGQASLTFGTKMLQGKALFTGAGVGYFSVIEKKSSEIISFVPLYFRIKSNLVTKPTSPYVLLDAGYAFALNPDYGGGLYSRLSIGINRKITGKTAFYIGAYAAIQSFSGNLTETNEQGTFNYNGTSGIINWGINLGLQF